MNKAITKIISLTLIFITLNCLVFSEVKKEQNSMEKDYVLGIKPLDDNWFISTAQISMENLTLKEAKRQAVNKACLNVLEYHSGIEVKGRTLSILGESNENITWDDLLKVTDLSTQGVILEKEIIKTVIREIGGAHFLKANVKVKVGKQKGNEDPYFTLDASLNDNRFQENEELEISCISSKDCYITIFNICSNDSVYVIFPNEYRKNNFLKAEKKFKFPGKRDKEIGLSLQVKLLPGNETDVELIKIIAAKEPLKFINLQHKMVYGSYSTSLSKLLKRLIEVPKDQIVECDLQYFIHK